MCFEKSLMQTQKRKIRKGKQKEKLLWTLVDPGSRKVEMQLSELFPLFTIPPTVAALFDSLLTINMNNCENVATCCSRWIFDIDGHQKMALSDEGEHLSAGG